MAFKGMGKRHKPPVEPDSPTLRAGLAGLNWLNLFVAALQAAFGPFLSVYLADNGWTNAQLGFALSVGTFAGMLGQVPAGMVVDALADKRWAVGTCILLPMGAALMIGVAPEPMVVMAATAVVGLAGAVLGPSIAALTMALVRQEALGERLGNNTRFSAIGAGGAAAAMGLVGSWLPKSSMFMMAVAFGVAALLSMLRIQGADLAAAHTRTDHSAAVARGQAKEHPGRCRDIMRDPALILFAVCMGLFSLGNAALLPLVAAEAARTEGGPPPSLLVAAAILVPQAIAAMLSPWFGRLAQERGRLIVLLLGFTAMPARALLFALDSSSQATVLIQSLDGLSAASLGVMVPLVVADITRRQGRFNLAMAIIGVAVGVGATVSTTLGGLVADAFGTRAAYLALALAGSAGLALAWRKLPDTAPQADFVPAPGRARA